MEQDEGRSDFVSIVDADDVSMDRVDSAIPDNDRDTKLLEFLSMAEGVDVDVATSLLESTNWDLHQALSHIFDLGRAAPAAPADVAARSDISGVIGDHRFDSSCDRMDAGFPEHVGDPSMRSLVPGENISPAMRDAQIHPSGAELGEDADMQEAIRIARREEDREIMQRQEEEYLESLRMDQLKSSQETSRDNASSSAASDSERQAAERDRKRQMERAEDLERKRSRLPAEPLDTDENRIAVMIRLPNGKRLQRNFSKNDLISTIYDFVEINVDRGGFDLRSAHPKKLYTERGISLAEASLCHQTTLMLHHHD